MTTTQPRQYFLTLRADGGDDRYKFLNGCPNCQGETLVLSDNVDTNFYCPSCHACWKVNDGNVERVEPDTCPGCLYAGQCVGTHV